MTGSAVPIGGRERIHSLDVVRGVALCGILLMNILAFGMPLAAVSDPTVWGGDTGENLWSWILMATLFQGTQRGLFSLLFGAGFIVLITRLEAKQRSDAADIYFRRSLWLTIFGVIHAYLLLWYAEVLFWYGMTAMLLYPLRNLAARNMLIIASASLCASALWGYGEFQGLQNVWERAQTAQSLIQRGQALSATQLADIEAWKAVEGKAKPDELALRKDIEAHHSSYLTVLKFNAPLSAHFQSWVRYRMFFDVFGMMLIGMALFKLGMLTLKQPSRVYWSMALIGCSIGLTLKYHEMRVALDAGFTVLAISRAHWSYDVSRVAVTLGYVGALLLFCRSGYLCWLQRSLAAIGRMALSNYIGQSVICAFVFYGFGLGLYGELERHQLYYVVGAIWLSQLILSPVWLRHFRFGPLEWIWRSLTYLERQPMRRQMGAIAHAQPLHTARDDTH